MTIPNKIELRSQLARCLSLDFIGAGRGAFGSASFVIKRFQLLGQDGRVSGSRLWTINWHWAAAMPCHAMPVLECCDCQCSAVSASFELADAICICVELKATICIVHLQMNWIRLVFVAFHALLPGASNLNNFQIWQRTYGTTFTQLLRPLWGNRSYWQRMPNGSFNGNSQRGWAFRGNLSSISCIEWCSLSLSLSLVFLFTLLNNVWSLHSIIRSQSGVGKRIS